MTGRNILISGAAAIAMVAVIGVGAAGLAWMQTDDVRDTARLAMEACGERGVRSVTGDQFDCA